jgi:hypothetical protein
MVEEYEQLWAISLPLQGVGSGETPVVHLNCIFKTGKRKTFENKSH